MKVAGWVASVAVTLGPSAASGVLYGPGQCVSLSQSSMGSCVIATDCEGQDISKFEFSFDCAVGKDGGIVRHSFGRGGFDPNEEFDTEVVCESCAPPTATTLPLPPSHPPAARKAPHAAPAAVQRRAAQKVLPAHHHGVRTPAAAAAAVSVAVHEPSRAKEEQEQQPKQPQGIVRYGPKGCVSTYKSPDGHCMMKTKCIEQDLQGYNFGLVCVDRVGTPVRHLFGQDSFDPEETFNTLIACDQCLGLEDLPDNVAINGQVLALSQELKGLEEMMKDVTSNVAKLSQKVQEEEVQGAATQAQQPQFVAQPPSQEAPVAGRQLRVRRQDAPQQEDEADAEVQNEPPPVPQQLRQQQQHHHRHKRRSKRGVHHRHHRHPPAAVAAPAAVDDADAQQLPAASSQVRPAGNADTDAGDPTLMVAMSSPPRGPPQQQEMGAAAAPQDTESALAPADNAAFVGIHSDSGAGLGGMTGSSNPDAATKDFGDGWND